MNPFRFLQQWFWSGNHYAKRKWLAVSLKLAGTFLLICIASFFLFRDYFLEKALQKIARKLDEKYHVHFGVSAHGFAGLSTVYLEDIRIIPDGKDTLVRLNHFSTTVRILPLFIGDVRLSAISLKDGYVQLVKKDAYANYANFFESSADSSHQEKSGNEEKVRTRSFADTFYKLINRILNHIPSDVHVEHVGLWVSDNDNRVKFDVASMLYEGNQIHSAIHVHDGQLAQDWNIHGLAELSQRKADVVFSRSDSLRVRIPFLDHKFNLRTSFDSIRLQLYGFSLSDHVLKLDGYASISNVSINHPKISKQDVSVRNADCSYSYLIGDHFISIDSSTVINVNGIKIHPFIKYENQPDTTFYLTIATEETKAQDFINALPEGLFSHIKGMEADGSFHYRLDFIFPKDHPDDMVFESRFDKNNFKITKYGEANLSKLNGEFVYVPMENGRPQRPIFVGAANPNYTPSDQISPFVKKCVLTTEDPSFFYHRGFVTEAFRQSIAKNIKTGKFKRGASTISMQLIKNVFLTREKTMARKLEEILLVYILENNYICPKERMFEVYLNIIEWGPNIYGIGEASQFYFHKRPSDLTLNESLLLATFIPKPKKFMWSFDKNGEPRSYLERTFRFLSNKMIYRQLITPEDTIGFTYKVAINGPARKYIIKNDSLVNDSMLIQEIDQITNPEERSEDEE